MNMLIRQSIASKQKTVLDT